MSWQLEVSGDWKKGKHLSLLLAVLTLAGLLAVPASAAEKPFIRQVEAGTWNS